jgi:hypothetical protein
MTLSRITIIWSAAASAFLTLALVRLLVWLKQPGQRIYLVFVVLAVSVAIIALFKLLLMHGADASRGGWRHARTQQDRISCALERPSEVEINPDLTGHFWK